MSHHRESSAFVPVVPTRNVHPVLYPGEMHPLMGAELLRENRERAEMMRENRGELIRASREDGGSKREAAVGGKVLFFIFQLVYINNMYDNSCGVGKR